MKQCRINILMNKPIFQKNLTIQWVCVKVKKKSTGMHYLLYKKVTKLAIDYIKPSQVPLREINFDRRANLICCGA